MIKVSVFYPNEEGKKFDMTYYLEKHMPLVQQLLSPACKKTEVDKGIGGGMPGSPAPYTAIGHLFFDSVEEFANAFGPNAPAIMGDIPNYTDIAPVVQVNEIKL